MTQRLDHAALVGTAIAGGGVLAGVLDWGTRPPCPDNYVRLIDVVPLATVVCGALAAVLILRAGRTTRLSPRRKEVRGVTVVVSVLLTVVSVLPSLIAIASLIQHSNESVDGNCWTF